MKKGKFNSSGFVLVETLIDTVVVLTIFSVLYSSFSPIIGEYGKREFYDDIDGKYAAYLVKKIIENPSTNISGISGLNSGGSCGGPGISYLKFDCNSVTDTFLKGKCNTLLFDNGGTDKNYLKVKNVYITTYNLKKFKNNLSGNGCNSLGGFTGGMHRYVSYLPEYNVDSLNGAKYRVIVEFERDDDDGDDGKYMAYSTFEVIK